MSAHDASNIYRVPLMFEEQGVSGVLADRFGFELVAERPLLAEWKAMADRVDNVEEEVHIAMVGKYTGLSDSYLSVIKALQHSSYAVNRKLVIDWIESADLDDETAASDPEAHAGAWDLLRGADGILVPGGFGGRGLEGKSKAAEYARTE